MWSFQLMNYRKNNHLLFEAENHLEFRHFEDLWAQQMHIHKLVWLTLESFEISNYRSRSQKWKAFSSDIVTSDGIVNLHKWCSIECFYANCSKFWIIFKFDFLKMTAFTEAIYTNVFLIYLGIMTFWMSLRQKSKLIIIFFI